jgi:hypothetical protein
MSLSRTISFWLAFSLLLMTATALAQSAKPRQRSPLDCGYTRLGQKDKAFEALAGAVAEGFTERSAYETGEDLAPLRAEPRFQELLGRLPKP